METDTTDVFGRELEDGPPEVDDCIFADVPVSVSVLPVALVAVVDMNVRQSNGTLLRIAIQFHNV